MGIDASFLRAPVRLSGVRINQDLDMHDTNTPAILHQVKARYIDGPLPLDAPVADFVAVPTITLTGLPVSFTDLSTHNPTSWTWDFGDTDTSTEQNPTHIYLNVGTYTVTLLVKNDAGQSIVTKTDYITVGKNTAIPIGAWVGGTWQDSWCVGVTEVTPEEITANAAGQYLNITCDPAPPLPYIGVCPPGNWEGGHPNDYHTQTILFNTVDLTDTATLNVTARLLAPFAYGIGFTLLVYSEQEIPDPLLLSQLHYVHVDTMYGDSSDWRTLGVDTSALSGVHVFGVSLAFLTRISEGCPHPGNCYGEGVSPADAWGTVIGEINHIDLG